MRASVVFCILASAATLAGQILDVLREHEGRPPDPPLISFIGIARADRLANDSSTAPAGPVARVVYEEFHLQAQGQTHPPTPWQTLTTEFDEQWRETTKIDKQSLGETRTAMTYQNGRIVTEISNFTRDGKPSAPEEWNYWTYNAAGLINDFRRGRGHTLENHYTNLKYDQRGRLTSFEYHQGAGDALFTRTEYKYVDERRSIEEAVYDQRGERFHSRIEFLDDQGRVVQVTFNDKGSKVQRDFAYDAKGRPTEQVTTVLDSNAEADPEMFPGKVTLVYDDTKHTRKISYSDGTESTSSIARFDDTGAIVESEATVDGSAGDKLELECSYDSHGNWTECRRWLTSEGARTANNLWRRAITYR
jgi:antitoxin component YwqK of YwqJK toxin-antitoxin module